MKTRGEAILAYSEAFKRENGDREAAAILYQKMKWLFSSDFISEEIKIRCIAEEMDHILCASREAGHAGECVSGR